MHATLCKRKCIFSLGLCKPQFRIEVGTLFSYEALSFAYSTSSKTRTFIISEGRCSNALLLQHLFYQIISHKHQAKKTTTSLSKHFMVFMHLGCLFFFLSPSPSNWTSNNYLPGARFEMLQPIKVIGWELWTHYRRLGWAETYRENSKRSLEATLWWKIIEIETKCCKDNNVSRLDILGNELHCRQHWLCNLQNTCNPICTKSKVTPRREWPRVLLALKNITEFGLKKSLTSLRISTNSTAVDDMTLEPFPFKTNDCKTLVF